MTRFGRQSWALGLLGWAMGCQGHVYYLGNEGEPTATPSGGRLDTPVSGGAGSAGNGGAGSGGTMVFASGGTAGSGMPSGGTQPSGGTPATGGQGFSSDGCPSIGGGLSVLLPEGYCIDRTEVTRAAYHSWLSQNPPPSTANQIAACALNHSFVPTEDWPYDGTRSDYPVVFVDWCDAFAYCRGVGKRLCGSVDHGSSGFDAVADASISAWYNACSAHGQNRYAYGSDYDANACNGEAKQILTALPVASQAGCQSNQPDYAGVYDLSGNVLEWEDACENSQPWTNCRLRGGSYFGESTLLCGSAMLAARTYTDAAVGFRCCSPEQR